MLKTAQLYDEEIQKKNYETWYDIRYQYWNGSSGGMVIELGDNNEFMHSFASVDPKTDEVLGYISYRLDWNSMCASRFGAISFDIGNPIVGRDMYNCLIDLFEKYHMNRVAWSCFADNPAIRGYDAICKHLGGTRCAYEHEVAKLQDGKLHDSVIFEIMAKDYFDKKNERDLAPLHEAKGYVRQLLNKKYDLPKSASVAFNATIETVGRNYYKKESADVETAVIDLWNGLESEPDTMELKRTALVAAVLAEEIFDHELIQSGNVPDNLRYLTYIHTNRDRTDRLVALAKTDAVRKLARRMVIHGKPLPIETDKFDGLPISR